MLFQIIAAINDARIDERRGFGWHTGTYPSSVARVNGQCSQMEQVRILAAVKLARQRLAVPTAISIKQNRHNRRDGGGTDWDDPKQRSP
jgi:hypothetical protein